MKTLDPVKIESTPGKWQVNIGPDLDGNEAAQVSNGEDFVASCGTDKSSMPGGFERCKANAESIVRDHGEREALLAVVEAAESAWKECTFEEMTGNNTEIASKSLLALQQSLAALAALRNQGTK